MKKEDFLPVSPATATSGDQSLSRDLLSDAAMQVLPGLYHCRVAAESPYREESTASVTQFYLPLYYWQDCGSSESVNDGMLVQGSAVSWGSAPSETANEHPASVVYAFEGLNPGSEYRVAAEHSAHDGLPRLQELPAGDVVLHARLPVTSDPSSTGFIKIPPASYADGKLIITVRRLGEGSAIVSQLWLKETGVGFNPQQVDGTIPTDYSVEQNYPNPFNPSTIIRFAIPFAGPVILKVYDITGREVTTLVNEQRNAGTYEVAFDTRSIAGGLASGFYFYREQSGGFSETRKMLLLK